MYVLSSVFCNPYRLFVVLVFVCKLAIFVGDHLVQAPGLLCTLSLDKIDNNNYTNKY